MPTKTAKGEEARTARSKLARTLLVALGANDEVATAGAAEASEDGQFLDDIVTSLVDDGVVSLARLPDRRASEQDLDRAILGPAFLGALDRRRGHAAGPRERSRLARLYALAGDAEKASSCYREVLDEKGYVPLPLVIEIAQCAARAGERAVALGAVDRIAEVVLTGDAGKEGRVEDVALAGGALERARDVALELEAQGEGAVRLAPLGVLESPRAAANRAVALARAAVLLYERSGLKRESARALDGLGRAQMAAGDRPAARATFERRRALAVAQGETAVAARSLETAATAFNSTGDAEAAVDRLEQAADLHASSGDKRSAARASLRAAELRTGRGDLAAAASTLERARAYAAASGEPVLEARVRLALARSAAAEGQLGVALREAEAAAFDREQAKDKALLGEARILRAAALLAAGARDEASQELARARDLAEGEAAVLGIELRAEVQLALGRAAEAHDLLADAARAHATADRPLAALRARVRRAEAALEAGDRATTASLLSLAATSEAPELVARIALLDAALATDEAEKRSALDRAFDLAFATDHYGPRVAAGLARGAARLALNKPAVAAADIRAALEAIRDARKSLPDERRAAFVATSGVRAAYDAGKAVREALDAHRTERKKTGAADDETSGVESAINALDVLLGQLGSPAS